MKEFLGYVAIIYGCYTLIVIIKAFTWIICSKYMLKIKGVKPVTHDLKINKDYFQYVKRGIKTFDVRLNDRDYKKYDVLILREWDGEKYTGKKCKKRVIYILDDKHFCKEGYVILAIGDKL